MKAVRLYKIVVIAVLLVSLVTATSAFAANCAPDDITCIEGGGGSGPGGPRTDPPGGWR